MEPKCWHAWLPQFEGHNSRSFQDKKQGVMITAAMSNLGNSKRKMEKVGEWRNNSTRKSKKTDVIEKEQQIVEAYYTTIKQQQNYKLILSHNSCSVCVSNNSREID